MTMLSSRIGRVLQCRLKRNTLQRRVEWMATFSKSHRLLSLPGTPSKRWESSVKSSLAEIGPLSLYRSKIASGTLKPDQDQMRAIVFLQQLTDELVNYKPSLTALGDSAIYTENQSLRSLLGSESTIERNDLDVGLVKTSNDDTITYGPKGIWLYGSVGTGKTLSMDLFYQTVPISQKTRIHFHVFMQQVYSKINHWNRLHKEAQARQSHVLSLVAQDLMAKSWLYCFDEFQVTDVATAAIMQQLFTRMFQKGAVMVVTSNRLPQDLYSAGFQRTLYQPFIDLLNNRSHIVHLRNDKDYRELMLLENPAEKDSHVYYELDSPQSISAFVARIAKLFYGKELSRHELVVYNRRFYIPKATNDGFALFTFDELCGSDGTPLGAADYLLLCQKYHTIVIQSIPQMGLTEKNEARRFITFIDAAYENKVKVICSAETSPERLFVISNATDETSDAFMHMEMIGDLLDSITKGKREATPSEMMKLAIFTAEDERFAFKRAVSRLKEMQSLLYLSEPHSPVESKGRGLESVNTVNRVPHGQGSKGATPSAVVSQDDQPSRFTDDFGDEASYSGYLKQYERYSGVQKRRDPIMDTFKLKEDSKPKFRDHHFWAIGEEWGRKAGQWGKGVRNLFSGRKKTNDDGNNDP